MARKLVCALLVTMVSMSLAAADEFNAIVREVKDPTKAEEAKILRYIKIEFKGDKVFRSKGVYTTPVVKDAKVVMGKYNEADKKWEAGAPVEGGLSAEMFKDPGAKTLHVRITRRDDGKAITQILIRQVGGEAKR